MPHATAAAPPPDEPPHVLSRSYGLRVTPNTLLNVWLPAPNSGVLVLPIMIAPWARSRVTSTWSSSGTLCAKIGEPNVVRTPLVGTRSLKAIGRPATMPCGPFRRSIALAALIASSGRNVTMALTCGFTRSICAMKARVNSVADTLRERIICASFLAGVKHSSMSVGIRARSQKLQRSRGLGRVVHTTKRPSLTAVSPFFGRRVGMISTQSS